MHNLYEGFECNDDTIDATFSLHSNDPIRRVTWGIEEPKDLDTLYHTYRRISPREKREIEAVQLGVMSEINRILSRYI